MTDRELLKIYRQLKIIIRETFKETLMEFLENQETTIDDFLSSKQAAQYLKIKLNTLYAKVEKGEIPHYKIGKRKLIFDKNELKNYIKNLNKESYGNRN